MVNQTRRTHRKGMHALDDGLALELVTTSPSMVLNDVQDEDGGAGCGGGVAGSPWWKVEPE